jgi:hypothetical protein
MPHITLFHPQIGIDTRMEVTPATHAGLRVNIDKLLILGIAQYT